MRELKLADGTSKLVMVRWLNPKNSSQDLGQYHGHAEDESKEEAWQMKKEMKEMIKEKPDMKPNQVRISVIKKHEEKNKGNTSKWDEIVGDMGNNEMTKRNLRRT